MWQSDFGRIDRALFLRSHRALRLRRLSSVLFSERTFWAVMLVSLLYIVARAS
jgi:hypothetical protein